MPDSAGGDSPVSHREHQQLEQVVRRLHSSLVSAFRAQARMGRSLVILSIAAGKSGSPELQEASAESLKALSGALEELETAIDIANAAWEGGDV